MPEKRPKDPVSGDFDGEDFLDWIENVIFVDGFNRTNADLNEWSKVDDNGVGTVQIVTGAGASDIHVQTGGLLTNQTYAKHAFIVAPSLDLNNYLKISFKRTKVDNDTGGKLYLKLFTDATHHASLRIDDATSGLAFWAEGVDNDTQAVVLVDTTARQAYSIEFEKVGATWHLRFYQNDVLLHDETTQAEIAFSSLMFAVIMAYSDGGHDPQIWTDLVIETTKKV